MIVRRCAHAFGAIVLLFVVGGPSGDDLCGATSQTRKTIDHVVLGHPHLDHASARSRRALLQRARVWGSGRITDTVFCRELLSGISHSAPTNYHTAADVPADKSVSVKGMTITMPKWVRFSDSVQLGESEFTILHADAKQGEVITIEPPEPVVSTSAK